MQGQLNKQETIAVMILQAIIIRKELIRSTPMQAAKLAREYADYLLDEINSSNQSKIHYLRRINRKF